MRRFLTAGTKESEDATVMAIKVGPERTVAGHIIPQVDGSKRCAGFPPPVPKSSSPDRGSSKELTHMNDRYVALQFRRPYMYQGRIVDPSVRHEDFDTFNEKIAKVIAKEKLDCIVQQPRINETRFLVVNLGADLRKRAGSGQLNFFSFQFARLADQLDTLHKAKIVHRDIKPGNMALYDGHARLFDNDTMFQLESREDGINVTTTDYLHPDLRYGRYNPNFGVQYGIMVDQHAFFSSMISVRFKGSLPKNGVYSPFMISMFLKRMPCRDNADKKLEIRNFMTDPLKYPLPRPLADYFVP